MAHEKNETPMPSSPEAPKDGAEFLPLTDDAFEELAREGAFDKPKPPKPIRMKAPEQERIADDVAEMIDLLPRDATREELLGRHLPPICKKAARLEPLKVEAALTVLVERYDLTSDERKALRSQIKGAQKEAAPRAKRTRNKGAPQPPSGTETVPPPMSEEERAEAVALAKDPNLVQRFLDDLERMGTVGVESAKIQILLTCVTRLSSKPGSATVKADSSAGKNAVTDAVAAMLPPEDLHVISGLSATALKYFKGNLSGKVLVIAEKAGSNTADYTIRTMESEGLLRFWITEQNPDTGRHEMVEHVVEGRPVFIETTTKSRMHQENETRRFDIYLEDSARQTRRIHAVQRKEYKGLRVDKTPILRLWRNFHRLLESREVLIPYVDHIQFPDRPVRANRDHARFLSMIAASALLHQHHREAVTQNGVTYVKAAPADYALVYGILGKVIDSALRDSHPKLDALMSQVSRLGGEFDEIQGIKATGWTRTTFRKFLRMACRRGWLNEDAREYGKKFYRISDSYRTPGVAPLLSPEELAEKVEAQEDAVTKGDETGGVTPSAYIPQGLGRDTSRGDAVTKDHLYHTLPSGKGSSSAQGTSVSPSSDQSGHLVTPTQVLAEKGPSVTKPNCHLPSPPSPLGA